MYKGSQQKIHVDVSMKPRFCKARSVPYALRDLVNNQLDNMESQGVISPVRSADWAAPVVPVLKDGGTSVRICGNYKQTVNRATEVEQYPIPRIEDLFVSLTGGESFAKLDLSQAYNQIPLDKESKRLTTINMPKGLFEFNRLPFAIASAPAIFQRTTEALLKGIPRVAVFLDDVLITGKTEDEHLQNLEKVLQC